MKKIKIGQIGVSHEHAIGKITAVRKLTDEFEVVGYVDDTGVDVARDAGFDKKPDQKKQYEGLPVLTEDELFAVEGLQAVLVETPNGNLVPVATRCMERGLAMHMDKPGGESMEPFKKLRLGCEEKNIPFQMGYMFRTNPAMQFCKKIIAEGWLGDIFEIQASMSHNYGGEEYQDYIGNYSGGLMFNLGCHFIDFFVTFMGRPTGITPFLKSAPGYPDHIKNNTLTIFEYPNAMVTLRSCSKEVEGLEKRILKICGTKGSVYLNPLEVFDGRSLKLEMILAEAQGEYEAGKHTVDFGIFEDRYIDQLRELAGMIRGEMENPYTYEHDLLVQEIVLAAAGYTEWEN